jgi:hypothetical protein
MIDAGEFDLNGQWTGTSENDAEEPSRASTSSQGTTTESNVSPGRASDEARRWACDYMSYTVGLDELFFARCILKAESLDIHSRYDMLTLPKLSLSLRQLHSATKSVHSLASATSTPTPTPSDEAALADSLDFPYAFAVDTDFGDLSLCLGQVDYAILLTMVERWMTLSLFQSDEDYETSGLEEASSMLVAVGAGEGDTEEGRDLGSDVTSTTSGSTTSPPLDNSDRDTHRMDAARPSFAASVTLGVLTLALYEDKLGMAPEAARSSDCQLAQISLQNFRATAKASPSDFCQMAAQVSLHKIELVNTKKRSRPAYFGTILTTTSVTDDDDVLFATYKATAYAVLIEVGETEARAESANFRSYITEGAGAPPVHLYLQSGLADDTGLVFVDFSSEDEARRLLAHLQRTTYPGVRRATIGPACNSKAHCDLSGFNLCVSPMFAGMLLAFFTPQQAEASKGSGLTDEDASDGTSSLSSFVTSTRDPLRNTKVEEAAMKASEKSAGNAVGGTVIDLLATSRAAPAESFQAADAGAAKAEADVPAVVTRPLPTAFSFFHARLSISHPAVALIEDPYDRHSRAFNADLVLKLDYQATQDVQHVLASLEDVAITSGRHGCPETQLEILMPMSITCTLRFDEKTLVSVDVTPVDINLASNDVNTAVNMVNQLSGAMERAGLQSVVAEDGAGGGYDAASLTPFWNQSPEPIRPKAHLTQRRQDGLVSGGEFRPELLLLSVPAVNITLIRAKEEQLSPTLVLSAAARLELTDWSTRMKGEGDFTVAAALMAPHVAAWEPLLLGSEHVHETASPFSLQLAIETDESKMLDNSSIRVVRECGHKRQRLRIHGTIYSGGSAQSLLTEERTFWSASGAAKNWVVFDMGRTVRLKRFSYTGIDQPRHMPLISELQVGDKPKGPWRQVCTIRASASTPLVHSPKFEGAGRFWRWNIKERHGGAKRMAYIRHVSFEQHGGGTSINLKAVDRLDLTMSSRSLARLAAIADDWQAGALGDPSGSLSQQHAGGSTFSKTPTAALLNGTYLLTNHTGALLSYTLQSEFDTKTALGQVLQNQATLPFSFSAVLGADDDSFTETSAETATAGSPEALSPDGRGFAAQLPITDIVIVDFSKGRECPQGYTLIERDMNNAGHEIYIAFSRDPRYGNPITDVQVLYCGKLCCPNTKVGVKENCPPDFTRVAEAGSTDNSGGNINYGGANPGRRVYVAYRRGSGAPIVDLTIVLLGGKQAEVVPRGFVEVPKPLDKGRPSSGPSARLCYRRQEARWEPSAAICAPDAPAPIVDMRLLVRRSVVRTAEELLTSDERAAGWDCIVSNVNNKGDPVYLAFRRSRQGDPPITALRLSLMEEPVDESWTALPEDLNIRSRGPPLYLHVRRDAGASPVVDICLHRDIDVPPKQSSFILYPQLNEGNSSKPIYIFYTLGAVAAESWTAVARPSGRAAATTSAMSRRLKSSKRQSPKAGLKALRVLNNVDERTEISVEVEGFAPLQGINVSDLGESTFLVPRADGKGAPVRLVVETYMENDYKAVVIRAPFLCTNRLPIPLEICLPRFPGDQRVATLLEPGHSYAPRLGELDEYGNDQYTPLYRFYSLVDKRHFYCTDPRDALQLGHTYVQELVIGFLYRQPHQGTTPLYGRHAKAFKAGFTVLTNRPPEARRMQGRSKVQSEEELLRQGLYCLGHILTRQEPNCSPLYVYRAEHRDDDLVTCQRNEGTAGLGKKHTKYQYHSEEGFLVTSPGEVQLRPAAGGYALSQMTADLGSSQKPARRELTCQSRDDQGEERVFLCHLVPWLDRPTTHFEIAPPLRFLNNMPCRIAVAIVAEPNATPHEYIGLLPGEESALHVKPAAKATIVRMAILPGVEFSSVSLAESRDQAIQDHHWTSGATLMTENMSACDATLVLDRDQQPRHLRIQLLPERIHGGPIRVAVSCLLQMLDKTGMNLEFAVRGSTVPGLFHVSNPRDLRDRRAARQLNEPVYLFGPPEEKLDEMVVASRDGQYRSRSFELNGMVETTQVLGLYRRDVNQRLDTEKKDPDAQIILSWTFADRLKLVKRFTFWPLLRFENETSVAVEIAAVKDERDIPHEGRVIEPGCTWGSAVPLRSQLWRLRPYKNVAPSAWEGIPQRGWSTSFSAHKHAGMLRTWHYLKMPWQDRLLIFRADCYQQETRHTVRLMVASHAPPYRIENYSSATISLQQTALEQSYVLKSGEMMSYAMDDSSPSAQKELSFRVLDVREQGQPLSVAPYTAAPRSLQYRDAEGRAKLLYVVPVPADNSITVDYILADSLEQIRQVCLRRALFMFLR